MTPSKVMRPGTPTVTVRGEYDPAACRFAVEFTQVTPPTPGQPGGGKRAFYSKGRR